jgi:hypothetical protein
MNILGQIKNKQVIEFNDLIKFIDDNYHFSPNEFKNGDIVNKVGANNGSNKIFAFAKIHNLNEEQTLFCFGQFYQVVLNNPTGDDHQNIRNFMLYGWKGINQQESVLIEK